MYRYKCYNAAMQTTAAIVPVSTGTSIKTMLQIAPPSSIHGLTVIAWGFSIATPQAAEGRIELIQTDVAATVTAHVAAGVQPLDGNWEASKVTLGTSATGYTATVEGSIAAVRTLDAIDIDSNSTSFNGAYSYRFSDPEMSVVNGGKFLRVRVTMGTSTNMLCWVVWDE